MQIQEAERRQQLLVDVLRKEHEHRERLVSELLLLVVVWLTLTNRCTRNSRLFSFKRISLLPLRQQC